MDTLTREVWHGERKIELTNKEYSILEYFMTRPKYGYMHRGTMLEENAWDYEYDRWSLLSMLYIRRLRRKIDGDGEDSLIQTVRGAGTVLR